MHMKTALQKAEARAFFDPNGKLNRAEAAVMIRRTLEKDLAEMTSEQNRSAKWLSLSQDHWLDVRSENRSINYMRYIYDFFILVS